MTRPSREEARTRPCPGAPRPRVARGEAFDRIGNYRLDGVLGEGGMGTVYRGRHLVLDRAVAIKLLNDELGADASQVRRFLGEARALETVCGPDVVELLDCGVLADGRPYLVLELLRGETLGERLRDRGALTEEEAIAIGRAIARALAAVHARGVIHRDLKPDNVFLTGDAWAAIKLLDFGVAKAPHAEALVDGELLFGTPAYMAPEQYDDADAVDHRADLFALGCVLFEMVTGRPPGLAESPLRLLAERRFAPAPRVRGLVPSVSPALDALIAGLLARWRGERPGSATAVADALDALAADDGVAFDRVCTQTWPRMHAG